MQAQRWGRVLWLRRTWSMCACICICMCVGRWGRWERRQWGLILKNFDNKALLKIVRTMSIGQRDFQAKKQSDLLLCVHNRKDNWVGRWVEGGQRGGEEVTEKAMTTVLRRRGSKCDSRIS